MERIQITPTDTSKVPNTSPTAASSGTDLNGMAVCNAIVTLKERIAGGIAELFTERHPGEPSHADDIVFQDDVISDRRHPDRKLGFAEAMPEMVMRQVSLAATGYFRTPDIGWDKAKGFGRPFQYYAWGMAVSEAEVDLLTGNVSVQRVDILHDAGTSMNTGVDFGQIEGGFIQGLGWVTTEDVRWDAKGNLLTKSPSTYKIPTADDLPRDFRVALLANAPNPVAIRNSKAVGEPPLMLALSAWLAIKDAVSAACGHRIEPDLPIPATNEAILLCLERMKTRIAAAAPAGSGAVGG
jgi:xanthine dehydrogenase molybdopterin-binding subunit B